MQVKRQRKDVQIVSSSLCLTVDGNVCDNISDTAYPCPCHSRDHGQRVARLIIYRVCCLNVNEMPALYGPCSLLPPVGQYKGMMEE